MKNLAGSGFALRKTAGSGSGPTKNEYGSTALLLSSHFFTILNCDVQVSKLSVSGCGLVSSAAVEQLGLISRLGSTGWLR